MQVLKRLLNKLNGLAYPQEYLCLAKEGLESPLYVYIVSDNKYVEQDITQTHLFIGYSPLVLAIPGSSTGFLNNNTNIKIVFTTAPGKTGESISKAIAILVLNKINHFIAGNTTVYYYAGVKGVHKFTHPFNQFAFQLNNLLYNKKANNVFLNGNLYKQVQIAYAVPRKISLITVGDNGLYNLFPTDLHGSVNGHYIISLRKDGKACEQVEQAGRIVILDIDVNYYKQVYALGKNHMKELKPEDGFDFSGNYSGIFNLPLPQNVIGYKELQLQSSMVQGIHKLLFFSVVNTEILDTNGRTLSHIHSAYATWRLKNKMDTEYFMR